MMRSNYIHLNEIVQTIIMWYFGEIRHYFHEVSTDYYDGIIINYVFTTCIYLINYILYVL